jgi:hypothetical protein
VKNARIILYFVGENTAGIPCKVRLSAVGWGVVREGKSSREERDWVPFN